MLNNFESKLSPDDTLRKLSFLETLPGGDRYAFCWICTCCLGGCRYHNLDHLGVPEIDMVVITIPSISVSSMTNYDLHKLKMYEENLGEGGSKRTNNNWCRVFYRHVN